MPTITTSQSFNAREQIALALAGIQVSDTGDTSAVSLTLSVGEGTLSAMAGSGVTVSGSGSALTLSGSLASIQAFLNASSVSYIDNTDTPSASSSFLISYANGSSTAAVGRTIAIEAINDAPTATGLSAPLTVTERAAPTSLQGLGLSIADVDAGTAAVTATLSVGEGTLAATAGSGVSVSISGGGQIVTLTGTLTDINAMLSGSTGTLTYADNSHNPVASTVLTLGVNDNGNSGSGGAQNGAAASVIMIAAVNDPPVNTAPASITVAEDTAFSFTNTNAVSIADPDAGSATTVSTTLSVLHGQLTATGGGATITGSGSSSLTVAGTLAQVNAVLGSLAYKGAQDYNGSDTLTIATTDGGASGSGGAKTDTDTVGITVTAVNDAPVANPFTLSHTGTEDTAYTFTATELLSHTSDVDGPTNTITSVTVATGSGTLTNNGSGTYTFTPAQDFNGSVVFSYTVSDGSLTSTSTASTSLTAVNDAPVASPFTLPAGTEDTTYTFTASQLLAHVTDVDGPTNTITSVTLASGSGTLTSNGSGTYTFTPAHDFNGSVTFNYTASDGSLTSASTASLNIAAVNDAPVANPFTLTASGTEDTTYTFTATELLSHTSDVDGPTNTITSVTVATGSGTLTNDGSGTYTFTPAHDFNGPVVFSYTVSDGSLTSTSTASTTLAAVNDAPVASTFALPAGTEDTTYTFTNAQLLAHVTDVDGPTNTITSVTLASGSGTLTNSSGTYTFTPTHDFNGPVTFSYTASDGTLTSSSTASLNIAAVNDAPVANPFTLTASGTEDTAYTFTATELLSHATDVDSPSLTITAVTVATGSGTVSSNGSGTYTFTPAQDFNGPVVFSYTVSDGSLTSTSTASTNLTAVNDAPVASPFTLPAGTEDTTYTFTTTQLLAHVTDVDGPTNTITSVTLASGSGTLTNSSGTYTFTPAHDFNGSVTFSYTASDGSLASTSTASLNIAAVNDPPVAGPVTLTSTAEDTANIRVRVSDLLSNTTDVDSPSLTITSLSVATGSGTIAAARDASTGDFFFTPAANFNGTVTFNFTASDGSASDSNTATLVITPVNDAPTITPPTNQSVNEDTTLSLGAITIGEVTGDTTTGTYTATVHAAHGTLTTTSSATTNSGSGTDTLTVSGALSDVNATLSALRYKGVQDFNGAETITVTATDPGSNTAPNVNSGSTTFGITVVPVNDAPIAGAPTSLAATEGVAVALTGFSVSDVDSGSSSVTVGLTASEGTISATPAMGSGVTVTNSGTNFVTLTGAIADINTFLAAATASTLSFTDSNARPAASATVTLSVNDNGATGGGAISSSASTSIAITPVNNAPVAVVPTTTLTLNEDAAATAVTGVSITDADSGNGAYTVSLSASHGALATSMTSGVSATSSSGGHALQLTGTFAAVNSALTSLTYKGDANYNGTDSIGVSAIDDGAGSPNGMTHASSSTSSISVTVTSVNDAPTSSDVTRTTAEDTPYVLATADFAFSDAADSPANALASIVVASLPATGSLKLNGAAVSAGAVVTVAQIAAGDLTFTPAQDAFGTPNASFTFKVTDDGGTANGGVDTSVAANTFTFNVTAVNDAPVAAPFSLPAGTEDTTYTFTASQLLAHVTDVDGPTNTITSVTLASGSGTLTTDGSGTYTFTPAQDFNGSVSFSYTASDGSLTSTSTASLNIAAVNDAPVASPFTLPAGTEDTTYTFTASQLLAHVTDVDGPTNTITSVTLASGSGTLTTDGSGTYTFTPAHDFNGSVSFSYTASDGSLTSASTASLNIAAVNDAPVASPFTLPAGTEDTTFTFTAAQLLAHATDVDSPSLTVTTVTVETGSGTLTTDGSGTYTFAPAHDFNGPVVFDYTVSDGQLTSTSTASTTLAAVNDAPTVTGTHASSVRGAATDALFSGVTVADPDLPAQQETATIHFTAANGTLTGAGTATTTGGVATYTVTAASASALTTALQAVTFQASGVPTGGSATTTVSLSVSDGSASSATDMATVITATGAQSKAPNDFNGDGTSDVLLQNGGSVVDWIIHNGAYQSGNSLSSTATGYTVVGKGDFNADGTTDVLLQNGSAVVAWTLQNGLYQSGAFIGNSAGFQAVGVGDFNGDGTSDIVLQNGGTVVAWTIRNGAYSSGTTLSTTAAGYTVVGTGDFNGDGTTDIVLQNGNTVIEWFMQNGALQSTTVLTQNSGGFRVVGTGDFNGDGTTDLILQNGNTVVDWIIHNGAYQSGNTLTNAAGGFTVVGTGDYNGDGTTDVLLQNGNTVVDWVLLAGQYSRGTVLSSGAGGFSPV